MSIRVRKRCRRNLIDDSVNIRGLKKYAVDQAAADSVPVPAPNVSTGKKIAVIGGGPAGLTAAYFLDRWVIRQSSSSARKKLGGMLRYGIPNYRFPKERLDEDIRAILSAGDIEVKYEAKVGTEISIEEIRDSFDAMFVAIGAQAGKKLRIDGEDAKNVMSAVEMLDEIETVEFRTIRERRWLSSEEAMSPWTRPEVPCAAERRRYTSSTGDVRTT